MTTKFQPNEEVKCVDASGYPSLIQGKLYRVIGVEEAVHETAFTYPEYVIVEGDSGRKITSHTYRFEKVTEGEK